MVQPLQLIWLLRKQMLKKDIKVLTLLLLKKDGRDLILAQKKRKWEFAEATRIPYYLMM